MKPPEIEPETTETLMTICHRGLELLEESDLMPLLMTLKEMLE